MKRKNLPIILLSLAVSFCLNTKKSGWDFRSPSGLFFAFFSPGDSSGSVGGKISGFNSGTLVLKNGASEISLNSGAVSYKFTGIKVGDSYSIEIKTHPSSFQCTIINSSGVFKTSLENADITCTAFSLSPFFSVNGKNWNDYIQRDYSKGMLFQTDAACNPSDPGNKNYYSCLHGGEIRKAEMNGLSDCTGITVEDNANSTGGALNWKCTALNSKVIVYSTGFRTGDLGDMKNNPPPGLSDLIDWTVSPPKFKLLKVTIKKNGILYSESESSSWWSNSFIHNTASASLNQSGTIYTFGSPSSDFDIGSGITGYNITAAKVAVTVSPGKKMFRGTAGGNTLVGSIAGSNFSWREGIFDAVNNSEGILLGSNSYFHSLYNIRFQNLSGALRGINIQNANGFSRLKNISIGNTSGIGIQMSSGSGKNIFENISVFNNSLKGIEMSSSGSSSNLFINITSVSNLNSGILIDLNSPGNIIMNSTLSLNGQTGMTVNSGSTFIMNSFISNNNSASEGFNCTVGDLDMTALNTILTNNNVNASAAQINSQGNGTVNFKRYMGLFKSSGSCTGGGAVFDGISASGCLGIGQSDFTNQATDYSSVNPFISNSPKSSSDTVNSDFSTGTKTYASNLSWGGFQNFYRTAGKENANPFPSTNLLSTCSGASTCRLYDWSFSSSDSTARNSVVCPEKLSRPTLTVSSQTILRNTYEILGDSIGDDDGLCESNEECIYTPNIGAYQGHGNLVPASTANTYYASSQNQCSDTISTVSGSDGTVTNIKLYKYEKNGY